MCAVPILVRWIVIAVVSGNPAKIPAVNVIYIAVAVIV